MATLVEIVEGCEIPGFGPIINVPGISASLEPLLGILEYAIEFVLGCVNDCYSVDLSLFQVFKIVLPDITLEEFELNPGEILQRWLATPGLGTWVSLVIDALLLPIKSVLEFICSVFSFFACILSKTPEQIAIDLGQALTGNADEDNCFGNIFTFPWPFPWDFIPDINLNIPCLVDIDIPDIKLRLEETGIDVGCVLGFDGIKEILLAIINGVSESLPGLCGKEKIDGFLDVPESTIVNVLGFIVYLIIGLLDKATSFASCFFENLFNGNLSLDFALESVFKIMLEFFSFVIPGFELSLDISESFERLKEFLPWVCVLECLITKLFGNIIDPFISSLNAVLSVATFSITAILGPLDALGVSLADILEGLGLPLIEDTLCIDLAALFGVQECSI